jgi:sugar/nucleoside kinase (ribokinase family)
MSKRYDVMALGSAIVDAISAVDDAFLLKHNIAKGVMTLVDEHRATQLQSALPSPRQIAGGSAANTLAGIASLGGKTAFAGRVNHDALGESFGASMRDIGVEYTTPMAKGGASTACCLIAVTPDGQRSMNTFLGAATQFHPSDVDAKQVAGSKILYIEGYLWDAPDAKAACVAAIETAKANGTKVAFTLSDPFCVGRYRDEFLNLFRNDLDILFANEEEAKSLFETEKFDDVLQATRGWKGTAALTRSEKGCVIARGEEVHVIDAAPVAKVIDTTGAGDQFAAGFLFGLTQGKSLSDSGRLGSMAAAEVIAHYGARPEVSLRELARKSKLL